MLKTTLNLDQLEVRECPAAIGWVKGGPQPEPPTSPIGKAGILLPALKVAVPKVSEHAGMLLPALKTLSLVAPPPFAGPASAFTPPGDIGGNFSSIYVS